jgi:hypothetical protein
VNKVDTKQLVEKLRSKCSTAGSKPARKRTQATAGRFAKVTEWHLEQMRDMAAYQMRVWLVLLLHSGVNAECWPSTARVCALTGLGKRIVRLARAYLVRRGLIEIQRQPGQRMIVRNCTPVGSTDPGEDLQIRGRIYRSYQGGSTDPGGEDLQILPSITPVGSTDPTEEIEENIRREGCEPGKVARPERATFPEAGEDRPEAPATTVAPATPQARAGARRLPLARARLELVGVPQDDLDTIDAEHLGALSAHDYSTALRAAERLRSVAPLLEEDPDVQSGSST